MNEHTEKSPSLLKRLGGIFGLNRRELWAWASYDIANSAFATTIMVAILPIYFSDVIASELGRQKASSLWAYLAAASTLLVAFIAPIMGVMADRQGKKKYYLFIFTGIGATCSGLLSFASSGDILYTAIIYTLATLAFAAGEVFYESLLPHVAQPAEIHRCSASAYALGYLGGGTLLALNLHWIDSYQWWGFESTQHAVKISFISVAIWWGLLSIPILRIVKESKQETQTRSQDNIFASVFNSIKELKKTLHDIKKFRNAFLFLLAFYFFSDGIGTIMKVAVIYGKELGISSSDLIGAILMVQFLGVPCTLAFGPISERMGPKKTLIINLLVYIGISALAFFMSTAQHFWILAAMIAAVQGATQAISRSIYATMIPKNRSSEFFSFYGVSSKFAGVLGPLIFGILSDVFHESRYSIPIVTLLFAVGIAILSKVDIQQGQREANL